MARKPRIHIPGGYYHVMLHDNGGLDIFFSDEDRIYFYLHMQEGMVKHLHLARERCAAFISQGIHEAHRLEFHCGASDARIMGGDAFAQRVLPEWRL